MLKTDILIIGGGLAGCEAAWQAARRGVRVRLYEMKPQKFSPAHQSPLLGELVCSNSLRAEGVESAVGLLKEEMRRLDSLIMAAALATRVPAGKALAVDRGEFAAYITRVLEAEPRIEIIREEVAAPDPEATTIIATGPLTSDSLAEALGRLTGQQHLHFYDAIAPIVAAESIDLTKAFRASRYGAGDDYLNCPFSETEYAAFYEALISGEQALIAQTVNRAHLWEAQTPQGFSYPLLQSAYAQSGAWPPSDAASLTDEAMLFERLGLPVALVEGEETNIKITRPLDLALAEAMLPASRQEGV